MSDIIYIYTLIDPRDNKPFYIGITSNPEYRIKQHIYDASRIAQRGRWGTLKGWKFADIIYAGLEPKMKIVGETDKNNAYQDEQRWVWFYHSQGYFLVNQHLPHVIEFRESKTKIICQTAIQHAHQVLEVGDTVLAKEMFLALAESYKDNKHLHKYFVKVVDNVEFLAGRYYISFKYLNRYKQA